MPSKSEKKVKENQNFIENYKKKHQICNFAKITLAFLLFG